MRWNRTRLAVVLSGDRLCAAAVRGTQVHTFVVESEQPATALRAELDARRLSPSTVAIGLPRPAVTVKPLELPVVGADMHEMVRFELERHIPFPTDDAAFDFVPLRDTDAAAENGQSAGRTVLVAAADRRVVETVLRLVQEARLRPSSVTVAVHDLVALARIPARARIVWLHRVDETLDMLFIARGRVVMSRTLPVADDATVAAEIRRSFGIVKWRDCQALWISGDAVAPESAAHSPLSDLGFPVSAPAYTVAARRALGSIEAGPRGALELAVAVAMAPTARTLNLLPRAMKPFSMTRQQIITGAAVAATACIIVAALVVPGFRDGRRLAAVTGDIARIDGEVRVVERMLKELEGKRKLVAMVENLQGSALRPLPVLRELTDLLPNDAWLTLVSLDAKGIELNGQANAASALIPLLENSPRFERVEFASPVTRGRDREQFRIQAAWEAAGATRTASAPAPDARRPPPPAGAPVPPPAAAPGTPAVGAAPVPPPAQAPQQRTPPPPVRR